MPLELKGFDHVFALTAVYNLGVSLGEESFKKFIALQDRFNHYIERALSDINRSAGVLKPNTKSQKLYEAGLKLNSTCNSIKEKSTVLFGTDEKVNGKVELSLKPYYVYFGLYAFIMLIASELIGVWGKYNSLMLLNGISLMILMMGAIKTFFFLNPNCKFWSSFRVSVLFLTLLFICFSIPEAWAAKVMIDVKESTFNYWLCLGSIGLTLSPIGINFSFIVVFYIRIKLLQERARRYKTKCAIQSIDNLEFEEFPDSPVV